MSTTENEILVGNDYNFSFSDKEDYAFKAKRGLTRETVEQISAMKGEPEWMLEFRLKSYDYFIKRPMPTWGGGGALEEIDFNNIFYYIKPAEKQGKTWEDIPSYIKDTFDKIGIPEAERTSLAGVGAQYESEVVYHSLRADLQAKGVIFCDTDTALRDYPDLMKQYFGTIIPPNDNKFAALNSAVWSGGSFVYIPEGVHIDVPLQAYFRIKRAAAYKDATMEWVDGNLGSRLTMKYPAVWLMEPGAKGEVLSIAYATDGQHQDAGAKMVHVAGNTSSTVTSKSISKGAGRSSYRGLVKVHPGATNVKSSVVCDALLLDEHSRTDTYPYMEIEEDNVTIGHEASVSKVGEEQLFYLQSRGLSEAEAMSMIVSGFIEPIAKELPLEYAVELNRLIQLEMIGSVG